MISPAGTNISLVMSDKHTRAHLKYYQIKTHVKTARESQGLNMDFRSFDNGFNQLYVTEFMQELKFRLLA